MSQDNESNKPNPELDSKIAEQFSKMGEQLYASEHQPINHIHIDLDCVQDTNLGALLCFVTNDVEYDYIISKLSEYEEAYDHKITKYFPALGYTESQVRTIKRDPKRHSDILKRSPFTSIFENLPNTIKNIYEMNKVCIGGTDTITIHWWESTIPFPDVFRQDIINLIDLFCQIPINHVFHSNYSTIDVKYVQQIGLWIIYDINTFHKLEPVNIVMCKDFKMTEVEIFALPRIKEEFEGMSKEKIEEGLSQIADAMQLLCSFQFINRKIQRET